MNSIIRYKQMWQLIAANFKEIFREPAVLFWGILFPILMSVGLGLAFTNKQNVTRKVAIIKESNAVNRKRTAFILYLISFNIKQS